MLDPDASRDLRRAAVVIAVALLVVVIGSCMTVRADSSAGEAGAAPHNTQSGANWAAPAEKAGRTSPGLLIFDGQAAAYAPGSSDPVAVPAGAEVDLCAPVSIVAVLDPAARAVRIPAPCAPRPLFADGFE